MMTKLLLRHGARCINLVTEDEERHLCQFLNGEELVELRLALRESLEVGTINEEDNTVDLREVVAPETTSYIDSLSVVRWRKARDPRLTLQVTTEIVGRELYIANSKFLRS
jgi:hypothetical protein